MSTRTSGRTGQSADPKLVVRLTPRQRQSLRKEARRHDLSVSAYVIWKLFEGTAEHTCNDGLFAELLRTAHILEHVARHADETTECAECIGSARIAERVLPDITRAIEDWADRP